MSKPDDYYDDYGRFNDRVLAAVRKQAYGTDFGQNSWTTADEYERLIPWMELSRDSHVLEVASGSGGPALHLAGATGCRVTGIDANENGVATAERLAADARKSDRVRFIVADANGPLPFDTASFDAILCIDAMNHLPDRLAVLREWHRLLRPGRRAVFTDPTVITGPVTNDELARRSSIGLFLFVPPGVNERLIEEAGLHIVGQDDVTANAAAISARRHRARQDHRDDLVRIEGRERYEGVQRFFESVHTLTSQRRLSRIAYVAEKRAG
jgi:SAM-dependent methyltransferase